MRNKLNLQAKFFGMLAATAISVGANASIMSYDITIAGNWFDTNGTPFGMPLSPTLAGVLTVDSSQAGSAGAFVNFSLQTGTKIWELDDFIGVTNAFVSSSFTSDGRLEGFALDNRVNGATGLADNFGIYSNNTAFVTEALNFNACNGCVSFSLATQSAPAPAPATLALVGLGLAGLSWKRRKNS